MRGEAMATIRSKKKLLISLIFFIVFSISFLAPYKLKNRSDYIVSSYNTNIVLNSDGSAYFEDQVSYRIVKAGQPLEKQMHLKDASSIEDLEVIRLIARGEEAEKEVALKPTDEDLKADTEYYEYIEIDKDENLYTIRLSPDTKRGDKLTYIYRYRLEDFVFLYKDTAALYCKFIGSDDPIDYHKIRVSIKFPQSNTYSVEGYIGGSLYKEKGIDDRGNFIFEVKRVGARYSLFLDLLMPLDTFPQCRKLIDNLSRAELLDVMKSSEFMADRSHSRYRDWLRFSIIGAIFLSFFMTTILFWVYKAINKLKKREDRSK